MKYIWTIIIIGLLVWGIIALKNQPEATDTTAPVSDENTVTYDGSNFSPDNITIEAGQTVTFVNNSDRPLWVASDPHPVHTGLAGFDAKQDLARGESYSFTFESAGSYGFHNHSNIATTGIVTVR